MVKLLPRRRTAEQFEPAYRDVLRQLSEASVHQHFDAFLDIPWDDPLFGRRPEDDCWILPEADAVGRHPWYRALPEERQREIGRYRYGLVAKVGLQFEQFLIAGVIFRLLWPDNENPEFRYAPHEITEETHHTQMFQEAVNRIAPEIHGLSGSFKACAPESRKALRDVFGHIRMLADNIGVRNTLTKPLWRALGIDGRPSRYRAQPASAAH